MKKGGVKREKRRKGKEREEVDGMRDRTKIRKGIEMEMDLSERIRDRVSEALGRSDLSGVVELMGAPGSKETEAALKIMATQKLVEYAMGGMKLASKKGRKITPSAVIIAAQCME